MTAPSRELNPASLANLEIGRRRRAKPRAGYAVLARMIVRMQMGSFTIPSVAQFAGTSWNSADRWVKALWAAKRIHFVGIARVKKNAQGAKIFEWGPGKDAPMPVAMKRDGAYYRRFKEKKQTLVGAWKGVPIESTDFRTGSPDGNDLAHSDEEARSK